MVRLFVALALVSGCVGVIPFDALDPTFESRPRSPGQMVVGSMDCIDYESPKLSHGLFYTIVAFVIGGPERTALYVATCTKDGGGIPWKVLGEFHVASIAVKRWEQYGPAVAEKARARGCPAVLIRRAPPFTSHSVQALGALCMDSGQPSGVRGPIRIATYDNDAPRILGDDEPNPPDEDPRPTPSGWGR